MDAKMGAAASNINNFEPSFDLIKEDECDTLLLYLPGFKKEQLRVQLAKSGTLRISGTRSLGDNKWSSFQKDFPVSENCDTSKITAKFEGGILYVRQPKLIVPAKEERDTKLPHSEVPKPHEKTDGNKPPSKSKDEEQEKAVDQKTTPHDDQSKPEKPVQKEELKPVKEDERKSEELEDAKTSDKSSEQEKRGGEEKKDAGRDSEDKHGNVSGENDIAKGSEYNKQNEGIEAAARLKRARQVLNFVLVLLALLLAFALGMYVNKPVSVQPPAEK